MAYIRSVIVFASFVTVAVLVTGAWAFSHKERPVIFQVLRETNCACGDYQEELSGYTVLNPFRDRAPEEAAAVFFQAMQKGECPPEYSPILCKYFQQEHQVDRWKLMNRGNTSSGEATLYYRLRRSGRSDWTGEGAVEVQLVGDQWRVLNYSSYF